MSKLAIILPGIGYTCDKPLLYYAEDLATQNGYECKRVVYTLPGESRIRGNLEKMEEAFRILYTRAEECLSETDWKQYDEILFISKSIGTVIAAAFAERFRGSVTTRHVLYTPLEYTFQFHPERAIGFLGMADTWCIPTEVLRLASQQDIPMHTYDKADHSLERGDVIEDLANMSDVMKKTKEFLLGDVGTAS